MEKGKIFCLELGIGTNRTNKTDLYIQCGPKLRFQTLRCCNFGQNKKKQIFQLTQVFKMLNFLDIRHFIFIFKFNILETTAI